MKRITPLILLVLISLTLMIGIGCTLLNLKDRGKSIIISGGTGGGGTGGGGNGGGGNGGGGNGGGGNGGGGNGGGGNIQQYKIVFENFSTKRIYIVNEDGTNLTLLDNNNDSPNIESWAMWSLQPINGIYKIVFVENGQLAIINEDGTGKQLLTNDNANYFPMWSPTGNRIAFIKNLVPGQNYGDLFMFDLTDNQQGPLMVEALPVWPLIANPPMWAPNSTDTDYKITFLRSPNRNGRFDIYLLSFSNGNGQTIQLTNTSDVISYAAWSKDGDKIAYVRNINSNWDIFVMDINTRQEYQITNTTALEGLPMWSPIDNNKLLFIRNNGAQDNPNGDIYIVDITDINNPQIQPIVITPQNEEFVVWRPDGNKIAFVRDNSNGDADIIVRNLTTGQETNLTQNLNGEADFPMWSPVPR